MTLKKLHLCETCWKMTRHTTCPDMKQKDDWEKQLDTLWFTKSGYQNENLPLIYDDIKALIVRAISQREEEVKQELREELRLWRPIFYRDKVTEGDMKILFSLLDDKKI